MTAYTRLDDASFFIRFASMLASFCRSFTSTSFLARQIQFFDGLQDGQ
jgi:hypothetical protein